jgi:ABC-type ATPase with predicted acetyltransferase domain
MGLDSHFGCLLENPAVKKAKPLTANIRTSPSKLLKSSSGNVHSVRWVGHLKEIRYGRSNTVLRVPRSACVTAGDKIEVNANGSVWVRCKNGNAQIFPGFVSRSRLHLGSRSVSLTIKEISTAVEFEAYTRLAALHYRNHSKHGRAAVLVIKTSDPEFPPILGYIELTSPFYVSKPRANFFCTPFASGEISWDKWDAKTTRQFLGVFVRISRCVVAPEFRGLGLGTILIRSAGAFAKSRWHLSGYLPLFLEISADMLRYVPFTRKAGFTYIGDTEGNLGRVATDMEYLTRNAERVRSKQIVREDSSGIVDQQVSRMNNAMRLMRRQKWSRAQLIERLGNLSKTAVLRDFAIFSKIVSLPKPTLVKGLHPDARKYIDNRKLHRNDLPVARAGVPTNPILLKPLVFRDLRAYFKTQIRRNTKTHAIHQAFGISPEDLTTEVLRKLTLKIDPGEIVVVTGPSGVGKTVLLDIMAGHRRTNLCIEGYFKRPKDTHACSICPVSSKKSLIEIFGEPDAEAGIRALSQVGLSDAYLYLRRFCELSAGQQYRAMLADLVRRRCNLAVIDEFCSTLDPITAHTVAASLAKLARRTGLTVVVAAPHTDLFLGALQPDKLVTLSSYGSADVKILRS